MSKTRKQDPAPTGATVPPDPGPAGVSRRRLLGGVGAAGATRRRLGAGGGAAGYAATRSDAPTALTAVGSTEAMFHGKHQPGITTPLQARGHLVAFDLVAGRAARRPWP
ncbi:Deferrochelatase OS=Streptomyces microflavus OX=1919 GN=efeB PE=3 SV=1 [Streptomyces microflavus]